MLEDSQQPAGSNHSGTRGAKTTLLFDIGSIRAELSDLLGVEVDLLTPDAHPDR